MSVSDSSRTSLLRRGILLGGALLSGIVVGAGGLAVAASSPAMMHAWHHGPGLGRVQFVVARALDSVGATSAQESKIHDIVAATMTQMDHDPAAREALRMQAIALLKAPTIDRAAVEALRAQQVAKFDAMSKTVVAAALDAADQLTPAQRADLADRAEAMMQRHDMDGGRGPGGHGHWMDEHGPMRDGHGPMHDGQGPDDGADGAPDKG